jgi:molybdopterin molybdotransferase
MSLDEILSAARTALAQTLPLKPPPSERVPIAAAMGRVLASDVEAQTCLPPSDQSAMDGYAVHADDCLGERVRLSIAGRRLAGQTAPLSIPRGACAKIMTGAQMIAGCDAVIIQEDVVEDGSGAIWVSSRAVPGQNIRPMGEHVRAGERVIPAGRRLRAAELALASALGMTHLYTRRTLRVGLLSTGSELSDPEEGGAPDPRALFDANRPMLKAALRAAAFDIVDLGICPDNELELSRRLHSAQSEGLDVVLCSGGAAQGDADHLRRLSGARFLNIALRPGRGLLLARLGPDDGATALVGLPGNAVAAYTLMHLVVLPWLYEVLGDLSAVPRIMALPISAPVTAKPGGFHALRGVWHLDPSGKRAEIRLLDQQGSAMIRSVADSDVLVFLEPSAHYAAGEPVPCVLRTMIEAG